MERGKRRAELGRSSAPLPALGFPLTINVGDPRLLSGDDFLSVDIDAVVQDR